MQNPYVLNRRSFLACAAVAGAALQGNAVEKPANPPLVCFSKNLQYLADFNRLAGQLAELGFDGTDLTVRSGGHIQPENVTRDLPFAVEAFRKAGLAVHMITTDITGADDPKAEAVLKTASALQIPYYRIGTWTYEKGKGIVEQLDALKPKMKALAEMNAHYNIRAGYHNHSSGPYIGGSLWEIHEFLRDADPRWIGYNFDAAHAVAEGAGGSWKTTFQAFEKQIFGLVVKDSLYEKKEDGTWRVEYPPVGQGMTPWPFVLKHLKEISFTGPICMHFEYPVPGDGEEKRKNEIDGIRRDINVLNGLLRDAGLR
jgi:L-ribulose-5-phosphate 3-epimerase